MQSMNVLRGLNGLQRRAVGRRHALRAVETRSFAASSTSSSSSVAESKEEEHGGLFSSWVGKIKGAFHSKNPPPPQPEQQPTSALTLLACADELKNARRLSTFSSFLKISPHVTEGAATESIEMRALAKHNPTGQNVDEKQKAAAAKECGCTLKEINTMLTNFEKMKEARAKLLQMKEKGEELPKTMAELQKVLSFNSPKQNLSQSQSGDVGQNAPCTCGSGKKYKSTLDELQKDCMHQVPSWKRENSHLGGGKFWSSPCHIFSKWIGQIRGQLGSSAGSTSSVLSQQWSTCLFARSMTMKSREDRRKKDLARREFQLLRRRTKLLKATLSPEERLLWRLRKSNRKKAVLLQRLKKYELEEEPEPVHDPELITPEQLQALKKIGYKNRNYAPVGRRGVYGGVVQNMHMHWKFHETVQVDCHIYKGESIRNIARQLAILSGGIVIDIHQSTTIIMYRGKNYKQPKTEMIPGNTLTKRKALFKSKYLQALEGLETNIKEIEAQLQILRRKQKENTSQGAEKDTSSPPQVVRDEAVDNSLLANLSEVSSSDDDGIFSWESDSLDEDELSDDDDSKYQKAEEVQHDIKKAVKPLSWTSGESARRGGKTDRRTAKELILAEQELFKNSRKRLEDRAQKSSLVSSHNDELINNSVDLDDSFRTDDDNDDKNSNGIGDGVFKRMDSFQADDKELPPCIPEVKEVSSYDLEGYLDKDISTCNGNNAVKKSEVANRVKGHQQIMNKKIAKLVEDFMTDEDEDDDEFGLDFENQDGIWESKTAPPMAGAKETHGSEGGDAYSK